MEKKESIDINGGIEERLKNLPDDFKKNIPTPPEDDLDLGDLDISEEQQAYIMMDLLYLENNNRKPEDNNIDLYPDDWFDNQDYEKQFKILAEAVFDNKKIVDTNAYQETKKGKYTR